MASIGNDPGGRRRILFLDTDGKRKTIRLGKMAKRQAEAIKVRVEHLVAAKISGTAPDDETSRWLVGLDDVLQCRLAKVGLIQRRDSATLEAFLHDYISSRTDVKPTTVTNWGHTKRNLVEYFGPDKLLRDIAPGHADEWRLYLADQGLAEGTIRKRCNNAKQFFRVATRKNLISSNPFIDLKSAAISNRGRDYFVTQEEALKVLDACPDLQWRAIFALCRYGGVRCPTEIVALRWDGIDWGGSSGNGSDAKMLVHSPKTEHLEGGESRWVPIFPELRPYLEELFEQAEPGAEHVITRYRDPNVNLRTQMIKIINRAGLKPWPKLFQSLRSTRETELAEDYPIHVVCAWIGNSQAVAKKHYLQVTDDHFAKAAQNPAQHLRAHPGTKPQTGKPIIEKTPAMQGFAGECDLVQNPLVGPTGVEPARPCGHMPLKHARLPIPPRAHGAGLRRPALGFILPTCQFSRQVVSWRTSQPGCASGTGLGLPTASKWLTTAVPHESLQTFTAVRAISSTRSTAMINPWLSVGSPTAWRMMTIITRPAWGMPAAPILAKRAVKATISCCGSARSIPLCWAMNKTATTSYRAVPSILMVAPKGSTNDPTRLLTPARCSTQVIVRGNVPLLDAELKAVSRAGLMAWANRSGLRPATR